MPLIVRFSGTEARTPLWITLPGLLLTITRLLLVPLSLLFLCLLPLPLLTRLWWIGGRMSCLLLICLFLISLSTVNSPVFLSPNLSISSILGVSSLVHLCWKLLYHDLGKTRFPPSLHPLPLWLKKKMMRSVIFPLALTPWPWGQLSRSGKQLPLHGRRMRPVIPPLRISLLLADVVFGFL